MIMSTEPTAHELKTWPAYFADILEGAKRYEGYVDDRDPPFVVDDTLHLREWDPDTEDYTGREAWVRVTHIARKRAGWGVLTIELLSESDPGAAQ